MRVHEYLTRSNFLLLFLSIKIQQTFYCFLNIFNKIMLHTSSFACIIKGSFFRLSKMFDEISRVLSSGVSKKISDGIKRSRLLLKSICTNFSSPENACRPTQKIRLYDKSSTSIDLYSFS